MLCAHVGSIKRIRSPAANAARRCRSTTASAADVERRPRACVRIAGTRPGAPTGSARRAGAAAPTRPDLVLPAGDADLNERLMLDEQSGPDGTFRFEDVPVEPGLL